MLRLVDLGKSDLATSIHPMRRFQHIFTGIIISLIFNWVSYEQGRIMITVPAVLFFLFDYIRRNLSPDINNWFLKHWGSLLRPHEKYDSPPGAIFFLLGIAASFWLSDDRAILYICIYYVSLCDPAASVFGILFGRIKITKKKSLEGTLAAGIVGGLISSVVGSIFLRNFNFIFGFFIAILAELVDVPGLDDNFTIPVIGCLLWEGIKRFLVV